MPSSNSAMPHVSEKIVVTTIDETSDLPAEKSPSYAKRGVPVLFAVLESICVFLIGLSKMGVLVGLSSLLAAEKASSFHSEKFRIPILLTAIVGSLVNLYSVWNFHRLRNAASAAWRRRPLTRQQKTKDAVLVLLSFAALLLVATEIYVHPFFGK